MVFDITVYAGEDLPALRELEELAREQGVVLPNSGGVEADASSADDEPVQEPLPVLEIEADGEEEAVLDDLDVLPVIEAVEADEPKDAS